MKYRQNDVHESILPTESTKTGCFCAHTRVHTERPGQWRSQHSANARAQHGHTTFVQNSAQIAEARRSGTCSVSVCGKLLRLEFSDMLRRSISRQFSARFAIDNDAISADNS